MTGQSGIARAVLGAMASNVIGRIVTLIAPFVIMPAMLAHLGPDGFGVWVTGVSIVALAGFMDFGLGNSLLTRLSGHFGRGDTDMARRDIGRAYRMLGIITLAGLGLMLAGVIAFMFWPQGDAAMGYGNAVLVWITLLSFLISLPVSIVFRVIYAHQKIALYNFLLMAGAGISIVVTLLAIFLQFPGWAVVSIYSAVTPITMVAATLWYFRRFPQYRPQANDFAFDEEGRAMFRLGLGHLRLAVLTAVGMNIDIPLVLYLQDAQAVADFALPARLGALLPLAVATVFLPLWAYNGAAMARQDFAWVRRFALWMSILGGVGIAVVGAGMTLWVDPIMQFWTGKSFPHQQLVLMAFAVSGTIIALTSPSNMVLNAAGIVNVQFWAWLAFVGLSVLGKAIFVPMHGAWVVGAVTAVCYGICITPAMIVYALRATQPHPKP
jgi:O-antigen/teichoic acid export membrane protein